jgi:hypothetical protein
VRSMLRCRCSDAKTMIDQTDYQTSICPDARVQSVR